MSFQPFPDPPPERPLEVLDQWLSEAIDSLGSDHRNPTAMTLATCGADQVPDARIVLCRGFDATRGVLTYFTDRSSAKGRQLQENPRAAVVFYWEPLYRQVRIVGPTSFVPDSVSDTYFASRMPGAQASALSSFQSQTVASRAELEERHAKHMRALQHAEGSLPRPERWGGYHIWIERLEFWTGRTDRLHDRMLYERSLEPASPSGSPGEFEASGWRVTRLQP